MSSKGGTPTAIFQLQAPDGLAVAGNFLYACDYGLGNVDTLIHNPSGSVFTPSTWSSGAGDTHLGPGAAGVAVDAAGNGYATASGNNEISVLPFGGVWTIVAGISGTPGEKDGTGVTATFSSPAGIAVDQAGLVYVAEMNGNLRRLRYSGQNGMQYASSWIVDTLVSAGATSLDGFTGTGKVRNLRGVTCARDGTLYLTEANDLRRLDRTRN
jgi:hypothetical protein